MPKREAASRPRESGLLILSQHAVLWKEPCSASGCATGVYDCCPDEEVRESCWKMEFSETKWTVIFADLFIHEGLSVSLDRALTPQWRDECPDQTFRRVSRGLTETAMAEAILGSVLASRPLAQLFPKLSSSEPLSSLGGLSTRSRNVLVNQLGCQRLSDVGRLSANELLFSPGLGITSVHNIIRAALRTRLELTAEGHFPIDMLGTHEARGTASQGNAAAPRWQNVFVALARLVNDMRGADSPVLSAEIIESTRRDISKLINELFLVTAADVLKSNYPEPRQQGELESNPDLVDRIDRFLLELDKRQLFILKSRTFNTESPATLDQIGAEFGVTRERIRQLERNALVALREYANADADLIQLIEGLQKRIAPIARLDSLQSLDSVLLELIPSLGLPVFDVAAFLLPRASRAGDWFGSPTIDAFNRQFLAAVKDLSDDAGIVNVDELSQSLGLENDVLLLRSWLEDKSIKVQDDHVLTRYGSAPARIAAHLSILSRPASFDELYELCGETNDERTFRNALHSDERFCKINKDSFALSSWGGQAFVSIREQIRQELMQAGRSLPLAELARSIARNFAVKQSSVKAYASAYPFKLTNGHVDFADSPAVRPIDLSRSRGVFKVGNIWKIAYKVNSEHLRGSGFQAPVALATALGVGPGRKCALSSELGEHGFYWTGLQPTFGSIRLLLDQAGFIEGDLIFLSVDEQTRRLYVEMRECTEKAGASAISSLAGLGSPSSEAETMRQLAEALLLGRDAPASDVEAILRKRGDVELADLVVKVIANGLASGEQRVSVQKPLGSTADGESIMDIIYG